MNKLQELSAGLVLLFGGDGPAAIRAGDALLADRIDEAIVEGGFSAISYGGWRKAEDSASRLEFDDIRLVRGTGEVRIADAQMEVFSQALAFEDGLFTWLEGEQRWHFERVAIERRSIFSRALQITAQGLAPEPMVPAQACAMPEDAACALSRIGAAPVARFGMDFQPRDREGVVTLAWESEGACVIAWTSDGRGGADLASWGSAFLAAPDQYRFTIARLDCVAFAGAELDLRSWRSEASAGSSLDGAAVVAAAPVLITTLFGLVADSYAYLLE